MYVPRRVVIRKWTAGDMTDDDVWALFEGHYFGSLCVMMTTTAKKRALTLLYMRVRGTSYTDTDTAKDTHTHTHTHDTDIHKHTQKHTNTQTHTQTHKHTHKHTNRRGGLYTGADEVVSYSILTRDFFMLLTGSWTVD